MVTNRTEALHLVGILLRYMKRDEALVMVCDMDFEIAETTSNVVRFLDNVVTWNEDLNALEKQRIAAKETRRLGLGVMGIADMLNQLGVAYDSD